MPRAAVALTRYTCNAAPTGTVRMAAVVLSALSRVGWAWVSDASPTDF
jgi:hypothetical protein